MIVNSVMPVVLHALAVLLAWTTVRGVAAPGSAALIGAATYLVAVHTTVLMAGLVGYLEAPVAASMLLGALVAAAWLVWRRSAGPAETPASEGRVVPTGGAILAVPALGALALWLRPHVIDATRLWIWDDYTYHMVYPALWLRDHAIAAVPPEHAFTMQAWYPLSASVVSAWFMLPFMPARGEALAWVSLTAVLYAALVAGAMAETLRRVGAPRGAWALPVVLFATSRRTEIMASQFSDADLAHAATVFAAAAFAIPRGQTESSRELWIDTCFAALLSGLAIGVKVSAVPAACVVLAMVALRAVARSSRPATVPGVTLVFGGAWLVTAGYWYARNWLHTGNPLYPAKFLAWPGATFPHTTLREYAAHWGLARAVGDALTVYLNWPMFHAVLALAGLGALAGWLVLHGDRTRPARYFASAALAITMITLLALPTMPFSAGIGMTFVSGLVHWDSMRYVALLPLLGWTALGFVIGTRQAWWRTLASALLMLAAAWTTGIPLASWAAASLVVAALVLAWRGARRFAPRAGAAVALASALALLAWWHPGKAAHTAASIQHERLFGKAATVIDQQAPGTRVAIYGDQWTYPAFGDRHHLAPVRLDADGRIATAPIGDAMTPGPLTVDPATFRANLRASGIGLVAVVHLPHPGRSAEWPTQAAALDRMEGVRSIYRDGAVGLWRLEGP
jgi:hypothetical protein